MPSLVSIIIPTYNRVHLLGETLDSVISQTYQHWECLVIDDGSTDHTTELMEFYQEKDARITYYQRPLDRPKGANACRNYGFELSEGEYINWFDDDDLMKPEKLEVQLNSLALEDAGFCVCKTYSFEGIRTNILGLRFKHQSSPNALLDYLKMKIGWMTPSVLWKRKTLENFDELFDEDLKAAQEWEFHCRALALGTSYLALDQELDLVRRHEKSMTYHKNESKRQWYYFLARLKVYNNRSLDLDIASKNFLENYLRNSFKKMIVTRSPFMMKAYRIFILPSKRMGPGVKFNALLAIISFRLLSKGNLFLQKIKYEPLIHSR